jgi:tetratricopeptide (TPR) repeat protein
MEIQDQVVDQVIDNNMGKMPINFSATCGTDERQYRGRNIDSILTFSRFMFRLKTDPSQPAFDIDGTLEYISDPGTFRTRGWGDLSMYKDEAAIRTVGNMAGSFTLVSDSLRKVGKKAEAEQVLKTAQSIFPYDGGVAEQLAVIYMDRKDTSAIRELISRSRTPNLNRLTVILSRTYRKCEDRDRAIGILDSLLAAEPTYRGTFDELMRIYVEAKDLEGLKSAMSRWLAANPADDQVSKAYQQLLTGWSPFTDSTIPKR